MRLAQFRKACEERLKSARVGRRVAQRQAAGALEEMKKMEASKRLLSRKILKLTEELEEVRKAWLCTFATSNPTSLITLQVVRDNTATVMVSREQVLIEPPR